ncbi:MAG: NADH-quinone oxidoreductase subunit NuoN [Rhodobacteraceae bacterium]|nr:NADH-quinone oxidoreductase subunit NuoN [Paracoccaceae bacterium]
MQADLNIMLSEIILSLFAMLALISAVYGSKDRLTVPLIFATASIFMLLALISISSAQGIETAFDGMFVNDPFARFSKVIILISASLVLIMSPDYLSKRKILHFEYPLLIALSVVGMMVMVSAGDLMSLYMGLELQSLCLYVIASMRRDSLKSTEAGLKYFVLGALSSGLLLYGASLTYGYAGTTGFKGIIIAAGGDDVDVGLLIALVMVLSGLAFKVSAVPFHMWTPDVYEGAPTPVTAFFATAPKMAAMALFVRVMHDAFGNIVAEWQQVVALISMLSMFLGAIAAIGQTNIKRLMAYSSIAHMGYALMGLAAGTAFGVEALLIYMAIYVTMNIGTFAFILMMQRDGQPVNDIASLSMLSRENPGKALAMLVLLFSLAGVPPSLGFFAKWGVWIAALDAGLVWLVFASALASAIGAYYYLRIVYLMYFGAEPQDALDRRNEPVLTGVLTVSAVAMVFGVLSLVGIEGAAEAAAATLVR